MNDETIVAVFDTAVHADAAVQDLRAANVPESAIGRHSSAVEGVAGTTDATTTADRQPGFWSNLFGGTPEHEHDTTVYNRSLASGAHVVTVKVPDEHLGSVMSILERHNPVDIDERATGYGLGADRTTTTTRETPAAAGSDIGTTRASTTGAGGDEVLSLSEEQLAVGKRLVNRGTTRIRRYVVETPVEQDVTLHSERVSIERRPAAVGAHVGEAAFKDRTIEVNESDEEVVVGKSARVREEVVVRKEAADRVETVRESVRREDVEIVKGDVSGDGRTEVPAAPPRPKI